MFIDSHAHLFFAEYAPDLAGVLARARAAGVTAVVNPGTDLATSRESMRLAREHPMIFPAVGFHPHDAAKADGALLAEIEELSLDPAVVAIGEIGLDYHYDFSPRGVQRSVFAAQIEIACRRDLPIIIHSREAEEDTLRIVGEFVRDHPGWRNDGRGRASRGVFHCFPGDAAMAETVIGWGFYVSIPGPVTFPERPNRPNLMASVVAAVGLEDMLLETDSPYLTPVPHRGTRNEPSHIPLIAGRIAEIKKVPVGDVGAATSAATRHLFRIPL
jgi:TatD DNase family protein